MPSIQRLRRRPDFLAAASGRRYHTERMTAQGRVREPDEMRDGGPAEGIYLGFTITKRVGHATERNRIRRRLRGAVAAVGDDAPRGPA
ncbi:ribonuclease P protein component, partial [Methylobacterium haplocladii]